VSAALYLFLSGLRSGLDRGDAIVAMLTRIRSNLPTTRNFPSPYLI
jgi:hypothetical protein